jgi:hypothetical protein
MQKWLEIPGREATPAYGIPETHNSAMRKAGLNALSSPIEG